MFQQFVELFWLVLWSAFMLFFFFLSPCSIKHPVPILQRWVCYFILSFYLGSFRNFHRFRNTAEGERLAVTAYLPLCCILEVEGSKGEILIWDNSSPSMYMGSQSGNKSMKQGAGKGSVCHLGFSGLTSPLKVRFGGRREMNILKWLTRIEPLE